MLHIKLNRPSNGALLSRRPRPLSAELQIDGDDHAQGMDFETSPERHYQMIMQPSKPKRLHIKPLPCSDQLKPCEPAENNLRVRANHILQGMSERKREVIENALSEVELRLAERNLDAALSSVRLAHATIEVMHSSSIDPSEPVGTLGLKTEVQNQLDKHGFKTLRSLAGATDAELLRVRGVTKELLRSIRQRLRELRISSAR